jgi:hypothetical protein
MKFFITGSMLFLSLVVQTPQALALTFVHTVPFSPSEPFAMISYGTSQSSGFSWTHNLSGALTGGVVSAAQLTVTYSRTNLDEAWQVDVLGNLASTFNELSSIFPLTPSLIQDLQSDGILTLFLKETTSGADSLRLHQSVLSGNYEFPKKAPAPSVPEPGMLIYFAGILGWIGVRAKRESLRARDPRQV